MDILLEKEVKNMKNKLEIVENDNNEVIMIKKLKIDEEEKKRKKIIEIISNRVSNINTEIHYLIEDFSKEIMCYGFRVHNNKLYNDIHDIIQRNILYAVKDYITKDIIKLLTKYEKVENIPYVSYLSPYSDYYKSIFYQ